MSDIEFSTVDATSDLARTAMGHYFAELDSRFDGGFDAAAALDEAAWSLNPPTGLFLVATVDDELAGCGAILFLGDDVAEIKRMWVDRTRRGLGVGKRLLARLEDEIRAGGRSQVLLDTNAVLTEAAAMYRSAGYEPTERYNDNPYAQLWFAKPLAPGT